MTGHYHKLYYYLLWSEDPAWEDYAWKESSGKDKATEYGVAATAW